MMQVKSIKGMQFPNKNGAVYFIPSHRACFALYEEGKGYVSLDNGHTVYIPVGGRKVLQHIIDNGGFLTPVAYVQPVIG